MSKARQLADNGAGGQNKNLVINGSMAIHQRGGTITLANGAVTYTLDRMCFFKSHAGTNTVEQSTDAPVGFLNSLKVTTTVADASVAAGDRVAMIYRMEGLDAAKLEFGSSSAKTITISFYVKSSITGTHGGAVGNGSDNRAYPFTYTISDADTWERKAITVAGDTTGTWAVTNARSLQVAWGLGVGSTNSGTAGAWEAADRNSASGATTGVLTTANATWFITGIQIEAESFATPFAPKSFAQDLHECERYYQRIAATSDAYKRFGNLFAQSATLALVQIPLTQTLRAIPTIVSTGTAANYGVEHASTVTAVNSALSIKTNSDDGTQSPHVYISTTVGSGLTTGQGGVLLANNNTSAFVGIDSEL